MNNGDPAPVRSVTALEKHLSEKITSVETSLSGKINLVEANLSTRIDGIEKLFASENRAAKEAVSIAMTAAEKAGGKSELAADERSREILLRLDRMEQTLAISGGRAGGVTASTAFLFQIVSSLASVAAIIGVIFLLVSRHAGT